MDLERNKNGILQELKKRTETFLNTKTIMHQVRYHPIQMSMEISIHLNIKTCSGNITCAYYYSINNQCPLTYGERERERQFLFETDYYNLG